MGYSFNSVHQFLSLQRDGWIGPGCRMLDLGSQDFNVNSVEEFAALKDSVEAFVGGPVAISQSDFIGRVPAGRVFSAIGFDYHCTDIDGRHDSIYIDLNYREFDRSLRNSFDLVCNQGTSEHLINQGNCFANIHDMVKPGGIFHSNVPILGLQSHGQVNLTLQFWKNLIKINGYTVIYMHIDQPRVISSIPVVPHGMEEVGNIELFPPLSANFHVTLRKNSDEPFIFPIDSIDSAVDPNWSRKLIMSAMVSTYLKTGMMDAAQISSAADRAIERLFPGFAGPSPAADSSPPAEPAAPASPATVGFGNRAIGRASTPSAAAADVAYRLFRHVADVERRAFDPQHRREGDAPGNRKWILEAYAQCLAAVQDGAPRSAPALQPQPEPPAPLGAGSAPDLGAPAVMRRADRREVDFPTTPVAEIVSLFIENGSVMLRNFVEPARLLELRQVVDQIYLEVEESQVYGRDLADRGLPDMDHYIFSSRHRELLDRVFDGFTYQASTHTRRMGTAGGGETTGIWQQPLAPHIDAFFHPVPFTVNFWTPFQPCGSEAPSLGVVRAPFDEVLEFVGYRDEGPTSSGPPAYNFARFNTLARGMFENDQAAVATFRSHYADRMWTPDYALGDVMMLSNYTLHFTHAQPGMPQQRENAELRFISNASLAEVRARHAEAAAAAA